MRRIRCRHLGAPLLLLLGWAAADLRAVPVTVLGDPGLAQTRFAVDDLEQALALRHHRIVLGTLDRVARPADQPTLVLAQQSDAAVQAALAAAGAKPLASLQPEGFCFRVTQRGKVSTLWVVGRDPAGLMYGGLEAAEVIRVQGLTGLRDLDRNPYMARRGVKFNCPLDVRTPSYTDVCDAGQHNIAEVWSLDFWHDMLDRLARDRYNFVSLWNLHPFPSMVRVPDYPKVALDDVQRSTVAWEEHYPLEGRGFCTPEILGQTEVLKRMTIDEKIAFWREVMRYGKERNIDFYVVTWNIFTYGTGGQYGITDAIDNATTRDYFRQSVKQMFLTYPDLAGIGLTTGENMPGASREAKEDWAFATYGQGVLDAVATQPGRRITFIHRQHMTGALDIADRFKPLIDEPNVDFIFSFKYAKAHVYSATTQPYHERFVEEIRGRGDLQTIWTLRNDDVFHFRWGAPDFVRTFMQNIPHAVSRGYYFGSDQYIWGREFLSTEPEEPRQIEVAKHWYHWLLWGRLGYDPTLDDDRLAAILQAHFPEVSGVTLLTAWQEASLIYPEVTGFHWGALDFQWYIESSRSRPGPAQTPTGFHDLNRFITLGPHPSAGNVSIPDYVQAVTAGRSVTGTTPPARADSILAHANRALAAVARFKPRDNKELRLTLGDMRAMGQLGRYYGHKIHAATELALFRETQDAAHRERAVAAMRQAAAAWRRYAAEALTQYTNPLWTNRVGYVDWRKTMTEVLGDLDLLGADHRLPSMDPSSGGTILEAETAAGVQTRVVRDRSGFTGTGYVEPTADGSLTWTFEAQDPGAYLLELRYTLLEPGRRDLTWTVDGRDVGALTLWKAADPDGWVWDRLPVVLSRGKHRLCLQVAGPVQIDHLNVLYGGRASQH